MIITKLLNRQIIKCCTKVAYENTSVNEFQCRNRQNNWC